MGGWKEEREDEEEVGGRERRSIKEIWRGTVHTCSYRRQYRGEGTGGWVYLERGSEGS